MGRTNSTKHQVPKLLLEAAATISTSVRAKAMFVNLNAMPPLDAVPPRTVLVVRDPAELARHKGAADTAQAVIEVPDVTLDRMGQVKLAAIIALSNRILERGDVAVFLSGPSRCPIDSLLVMTIGTEYELFDSMEQSTIEEHVRRAVFFRVLELALHVGQYGREGRKVGALLVVGDHANVLDQSEQMILNPFKGYSDAERNILDEQMTETVKEFSALDGAFIIRGNGVIETAGARLKAGLSEGLPPGLGARHAAAAGITDSTRAIAFTVSESDGTVRVWRGGKMVASFEPTTAS